MTRTITPTHVLLNQITLAASASSVIFSSIPQNYGDLVVIANGSPSDTSFPSIVATLNLDTGNNYSMQRMTGAAIAGSASSTSQNVMPISSGAGAGPSTSSRFALICNFQDYSATDKHKTVLSRNGAVDAAVEASACRWANTNAIVSIEFKTNTTAQFATGSTFSLYGVHA